MYIYIIYMHTFFHTIYKYKPKRQKAPFMSPNTKNPFVMGVKKERL